MTNAQEGDRAAWFLEGVVRPTLAEFVADQGDLRRGVLATIVVNQFVDYIAEADPRSTSVAINEMVEGCERLALVRDAANAAKHSVITRKRPELVRIHPPNADALRPDTIERWEGGALGVGALGAAPLGGGGLITMEIVVVSRPDGPDLWLSVVLQEALCFLEERLHSIIDEHGSAIGSP